MTNKRLKVLVLIKFIIFILYFPSCGKGKQVKVKNDVMYNYKWEAGKLLFYNKCGQCHTPIIKDKIFESYNSLKRGENIEKRVTHLKTTLYDSNHLNKNIGIEELSSIELEQLLIFIETPLKRTVH